MIRSYPMNSVYYAVWDIDRFFPFNASQPTTYVIALSIIITLLLSNAFEILPGLPRRYLGLNLRSAVYQRTEKCESASIQSIVQNYGQLKLKCSRPPVIPIRFAAGASDQTAKWVGQGSDKREVEGLIGQCGSVLRDMKEHIIEFAHSTMCAYHSTNIWTRSSCSRHVRRSKILIASVCCTPA